MIVQANPKGKTKIGRLGENEHRVIRFAESARVLAEYPSASVVVLHKRPGDPDSYPVNSEYVQIIDGIVYWTVMSGDLTKVGDGEAELIYTQDSVIAKKQIYNTEIGRALDGSGTPPAPWASWQQGVKADADRAEAAAELLEHPEAEANTLEPGSPATASYSNGKFTFGIPEGEKGDPGDPGQDYTLTEQDKEDIAELALQSSTMDQKIQAAEDAAEDARGWANGTDKNGDPVSSDDPHYENNAYYFMLLCLAATGHYPKVENGYWYIWDVQNEQWATTGVKATGADGVSPTITITSITGGHRITVTDADGDHSLDVMNGINGTNGTDGTDGEDGVTFTPSVSSAGVISWTNDGNRQNPSPVDIPALVEGVFVETVSGTTPSITGADNHRYVCGEVSMISITAPASGTIEVIFESGSTAAILTASGVMWPDWFDATALETDRIYDLMITDGLYGSVMSWASA